MVSKPISPFTQEHLNRIFTISAKHSDRLTSRESNWLEFKESFNFGSLGKYIRTAAGFANAGGGYIVYGIGRHPHTLLGLRGDAFDRLDPEKLSRYLCDHFDPEIHWEQQVYELRGRSFGLLYFRESQNKPVMCKMGTEDGKSLKEGEIYYRYRGRTQTIRYQELKELIEERRSHEQLLWLKHLKEIARIGISDVGLFDLRSGMVSGSGGSFLIDESLLPQLSFIRDGEFNEVKGRPAIKIIGTARPIGNLQIGGGGGRPHILRQKGIRTSDIILAFLKSETLDDPKGYLSQITYETSAYLPFHFLIRQGKFNLVDAKKLVEAERSTAPTKARLLKRLESDSTLRVQMPSTVTKAGMRKLKVRGDLLIGLAPVEAEGEELNDLLDSIRTLTHGEVKESYLKSILLQIFNRKFAQGDTALNDRIRKTVCYLDLVLNGTDISPSS
jgi:hypothetical protein